MGESAEPKPFRRLLTEITTYREKRKARRLYLLLQLQGAEAEDEIERKAVESLARRIMRENGTLPAGRLEFDWPDAGISDVRDYAKDGLSDLDDQDVQHFVNQVF